MTDSPCIFHILKNSGTHADVFAAVGLADLLASVPRVRSPRLREHPTEFEVCLEQPLSDAFIESIPQAPGYPFLKANAKVKVPASAIDVVDYKAEKEKADRRNLVFALKGKAKKKQLGPEIQQIIQQEELREDWRLLQVLNTLQGDETSNKVHEAVVTSKANRFWENLKQALGNLSQGKSSALDWEVSMVQLFTPIAAKGYSRLKPDSTDRNDKTKEHWADPFIEWLKYRGYFRVGCPFFQGPKAEHVRLLCPIPHDISFAAFCSVSRELRKGGINGGPPKMDALTVLRLAELLIRHSEEYHDIGKEIFPGLSLEGKSPEDAISGVMVTHYQSLGNAKAVSAMSVIAIPGWFEMRSHQDAENWLAILDEHQRVIRGLQDDRSDEIGLLIAYRRFLEKRGEEALWALIEFMEQYAAVVMRVNANNRRMKRFTDEHFRRIVMGIDNRLLGIVNDPGFEAVARAVRQATVTAQNKKARGEDVWRDIRYELLHDIHRTRKVPGAAFVECIGEFISRYNYENARQREAKKNPKAAPANVSDEELKSFLALVDQHGASVVGALLAAYGSCKEKWEAEDAERPETPDGDTHAEPA